jgi:ribosomal protein S19
MAQRLAFAEAEVVGLVNMVHNGTDYSKMNIR